MAPYEDVDQGAKNEQTDPTPPNTMGPEQDPSIIMMRNMQAMLYQHHGLLQHQQSPPVGGLNGMRMAVSRPLSFPLPSTPSYATSPTTGITTGMSNLYHSQFGMGIPYPPISMHSHMVSTPPIDLPKEEFELRKIIEFMVQTVLRVHGKVYPQELANMTQSQPGGITPATVNEDGKSLDFVMAFYKFVVLNGETEDSVFCQREALLLTLELHLPTSIVNQMKFLPIGMPVPSYLHLPPHPPPHNKYTTTPGPCRFGTTFQQRFEEYINKGFNNLLNRIEKGIPVETGKNVYDHQYDYYPQMGILSASEE